MSSAVSFSLVATPGRRSNTANVASMNGRLEPMTAHRAWASAPSRSMAGKGGVATGASGGVVRKHRLPIALAFDLGQQAGPQRRDVLDAVQAVREQLAGLEEFQMRGRHHAALAADVDDRLRARQRQPEIDLDRGCALRHRPFGKLPRFIGVAGDHRIAGIGRPWAVDVGAGRVDARAAQAVGGDRRTQAREGLVPLAGVAERRDAVGQLAERELCVGRRVVDMEVRVHQAGQDRSGPTGRRAPRPRGPARTPPGQRR